MEIKKLREERKISQAKIAKYLNVSVATVSRYENGEREPDNDTLDKLATFFNVSTDVILGRKPSQQIVADGRGVRIHVYSKIPAGVPIEAVDDIVDFEDLPIEMITGGKEYIGFKVSGDSMYPKYIEGDTVIVLLQPDCESGQDCAVYVNGYDVTLKKVIKQDDGILLQPLNSKYEPVFYPFSGKESVNIIGTVVELRRKFI